MRVYRWAVNCSNWTPCSKEWLAALSLVASEERERVGKFVFERDAKLALVGRLLIRAVLTLELGVDNEVLKLGRSDKGKPLLIEPSGCDDIYFNVSHQGVQYFVSVGVDVMQFTQPRGDSVSGFFHTMRRQFTSAEWLQIKQPALEHKQLKNFYRFWCLKESFIKAEGSGLSYGLQNLEFTAAVLWPPTQGSVCVGSKLCVGGTEEMGDWLFEESLLDSEHCVCVASRGKTKRNFSFKLVQDLVSQLTAVTEMVD